MKTPKRGCDLGVIKIIRYLQTPKVISHLSSISCQIQRRDVLNVRYQPCDTNSDTHTVITFSHSVPVQCHLWYLLSTVTWYSVPYNIYLNCPPWGLHHSGASWRCIMINPHILPDNLSSEILPWRCLDQIDACIMDAVTYPITHTWCIHTWHICIWCPL